MIGTTPESRMHLRKIVKGIGTRIQRGRELALVRSWGVLVNTITPRRDAPSPLYAVHTVYVHHPAIIKSSHHLQHSRSSYKRQCTRVRINQCTPCGLPHASPAGASGEDRPVKGTRPRRIRQNCSHTATAANSVRPLMGRKHVHLCLRTYCQSPPQLHISQSIVTG